MNASGDGFVFTAPGLSDLVADSSAEFAEVLLGTIPGGNLKVGPDGLLYFLSFGLWVEAGCRRISRAATAQEKNTPVIG